MRIKGFFDRFFSPAEQDPVEVIADDIRQQGAVSDELSKKIGLHSKRRNFTGMTLGQKQREFTLMVAELIQYAYSQGYELTFGDAYRDPRLHGAVGVKAGYGSANSVHKERLAVDLNLFRGGVYQTSTESHKPLGEYWESLGGSWGGRFEDGNHYSIEHQGRK